MPKTREAGIVAQLNYNNVRYAHVFSRAGEQQILTSDPWAFIQRTLLQQRERRKGVMRQNLDRAIYFADLAADFYRATDTSTLPIKGTLAYYGMLNLVKTFISVKGVKLESKIEHHGLSLEPGHKQTIRIAALSTDSVNVFAEFARLLNKPVTAKSTATAIELFSHIPELHSLYVSLGHAPKRKLLPIEIIFQVNQAKTYLFTELHYEKRKRSALSM